MAHLHDLDGRRPGPLPRGGQCGVALGLGEVGGHRQHHIRRRHVQLVLGHGRQLLDQPARRLHTHSPGRPGDETTTRDKPFWWRIRHPDIRRGLFQSSKLMQGVRAPPHTAVHSPTRLLSLCTDSVCSTKSPMHSFPYAATSHPVRILHSNRPNNTQTKSFKC
jgi:hypothetical protein